jgi:hypothetical protein
MTGTVPPPGGYEGIAQALNIMPRRAKSILEAAVSAMGGARNDPSAPECANMAQVQTTIR